MSYLALARKWRPKTFADTVGQEHVLKALVNALDSERLHHAYLFTGTRGVGKTTIARIFAKSLNCENGVSSTPCGECSACVEIDEGRFVDLIEVDGASNTKVDDTRELLDNVQYAPTRGRFKVYLIDEVHMLSISSFNALLKTLEEPPPHVKFLLATTDPQKVPVTVLSRCLQFNLKRLTRGLIMGRIREICDTDSIKIDDGAVGLLATAADGSLRDALSLLDQAVAYCGGDVDETSVAKMLGTIDRGHVLSIVRELAAGDATTVIQIIREVDEQYPDYGRLLEDLARILQKVAVYQAVGSTETDGETDDSVLAELAEALDPADIQLFYQAALIGRRDLDLAPDPRSGAEMALLRMLAFKPAAESNSAPSTPVPSSRPASSNKKKVEAAPVEEVTAKADWQEPDWSQLTRQLGLQGSLRLLASNCAYIGREGNVIQLGLDRRSESYLTRQRKEQLADALSKHFGEKLSVDISIGETPQETPVQQESRLADEQLEAARQSLESDPNVQAMKSMFGAELKTDTIEPLGNASTDRS